MKEKIKFVIFGATGDLTKRKLIPALYNLITKNSINNFEIICIARKEFTKETFVEYLKIEYKKFYNKIDDNTWNKLKEKIEYLKVDFNELDKLKLNTKNAIYYLATMPENYELIIKYLKKNSINNSKIIIEKPFGYNLKDAIKINNLLKKSFTEEQIYRIDHYLAKEAVQNLLVFRFANTIFEPIWNNKYIDNIQITISEDIGVENRSIYYEKAGAIKDMVQNHILQILTLVTMENPKLLNYKNIEEEKIKVLRKLKIKNYLLGQYKGYREEINKDSNTETYAAIKMELNNKRMKGVPIYIRTGKNLKKKESLIYIKFHNHSIKEVDKTNSLVIRIYPENDIELYFNQKKPGSELKIQNVRLNFCYSCLYGYNTSEAYEELIKAIIRGDKTLFTSWNFTENAWKIVDKIKSNNVIFYNKKTKGPREADELILKDNKEWFDK